MTVACLGWGSLIWDPRELPLSSPWFEDGPLIRVEFARQSDNGRMTLVIVPTGPLVRCLWSFMKTDDVETAHRQLMLREGTQVARNVSTWVSGCAEPTEIPGLAVWAAGHGAAAVVWTSLGPRFMGKPVVPSEGEVVNYLGQLDGEKRSAAEEYVRQAPKQIDTPYRRAIASTLGWLYREAQ